MKVKYFLRKPIGEPLYAQDHSTWIMLGRFCHMYCPDYKMWFILDPSPSVSELIRKHTHLEEVKWTDFRFICGKRAILERIEDFLHFRFQPWAKYHVEKEDWIGRRGFIQKIARIDDKDDPFWYIKKQPLNMSFK